MRAIKYISSYIRVIMCVSMPVFECLALSDEIRDKGFVYVHEVDPTIIISPRYYSNENFIGERIDGYAQPIMILTKRAADALKKVQAAVKKDGYCLVLYDAYRPQKAVDHFVRWSEDEDDQRKKTAYYPRIPKGEVFERGYIAKRSGHSRGSTVDLTLIKEGQAIHPIQESSRMLLDGYMITFLDDGTVDMGSSFDLFDEASHTENNLIEEKYQVARNYLKDSMEQHGFNHYAQEWWHFTLKEEAFSAGRDESYFNFPVE